MYCWQNHQLLISVQINNYSYFSLKNRQLLIFKTADNDLQLPVFPSVKYPRAISGRLLEHKRKPYGNNQIHQSRADGTPRSWCLLIASLMGCGCALRPVAAKVFVCPESATENFTVWRWASSRIWLLSRPESGHIRLKWSSYHTA